MYDEFETINSMLKQMNLSIKMPDFNGAFSRDAFGAIEGLTVMVRDSGEEIVDALDRLTTTVTELT